MFLFEKNMSIQRTIVNGRNLYDRKYHLMKDSDCAVVLTGGLGTIEEAVTQIQSTNKSLVYLSAKSLVYISSKSYSTRRYANLSFK